MRDHLQPWYDAWLTEHAASSLLYVSRNSRGEPYLEQVHFVRDDLARLLWKPCRLAPLADADCDPNERGPL